MSGADVERKSTTCFVVSRRDQSLELTTSSPRETDEWCAALQKAIDAQKHRAQCDAEALSKIAEVVSTPVDVAVNGQVFRGIGNTFESAQTIKERAVTMMVAPTSPQEQQRASMLFDAYFLRVVSVNIFLVPEQVPLKELPVFVLCSRTLSVPTLELVSKQKLREEGVDLRELADTRQTTLLISRSRSVEEKRETLMGQRYTTLLASQTASPTPDPEFLPARQSLLKYVADVNDTICQGRSPNDRYPQFFGTEPMPREAPESVWVTGTMPKDAGFKTIVVSSMAKPSEVLAHFYHSFIQKTGLAEDQYPLSSYCLKVAGYRSYLIEEVPLLAFDYVRMCINRNIRIELVMVRPEQSQTADPEVDDFLSRITRVRAEPRRRPLPVVATPTPVADAGGDGGTRRLTVGASQLGQKLRAHVGEVSINMSEVIEGMVDYATSTIDVTLTVHGQLLHGVVPLTGVVSSTGVVFKHTLRAADDIPYIAVNFNEWLTFDVSIRDVPPETALRITLTATQNTTSSDAAGGATAAATTGQEQPEGTPEQEQEQQQQQQSKAEELGWINFMLYGSDMWLRNTDRHVALWPGAAPSYIGVCCDNIFVTPKTSTSTSAGTGSQAIGEFVELALEGCGLETGEVWDVFYDAYNSAEGLQSLPEPARPRDAGAPEGGVTPELRRLVDVDRGQVLSAEERLSVQYHREELKWSAEHLKVFLLSVDWKRRSSVAEARRLLGEWAAAGPSVGLELLDWRLADERVRAHGVGLVDGMADGELARHLVQLVGVVQYEPRHDSALARLLLRRALASPVLVGQPLFWLLRAETEAAANSSTGSSGGRLARLGLILEAFLRGCDTETVLFLHGEVAMMGDFAAAASAVKEEAKEARADTLKYQLRRLNFAPRFELPLFSDRECAGLVLGACRFMKSKKLPLWLVFRNADPTGEDTYVLYKLGDDLRQDVLTLQLLELMDRTWIAAESLDLLLRPYHVMATGDSEGLVEIVRHAETIGGINRAAGGTVAVLRPDVLSRWLQEKNPDPDAYRRAVRTFAVSCAGYCVATYVLGIADRHNDNIMVCEDGRLFHIDFGHILGHFKKKLGVKRERAPMIFTPQMAHVLGGLGSEMYTLFQNRAVQGFLVLRRHASLFTTVLTMSLCCGLPEVQTVDDVRWVRDHLHLDLSDPDASSFFLNLIEESLHTVSTQLMDMIHIIAN